MSASDVPTAGFARGLSSMAVRAAAAGMRPLGGEVERLLGSPRLQDLVDQALRSETATDVIDAFFNGPLFGRFVDGLLDGQALWTLVDRVASSPAVTAAVSQQGLGFADQLGVQLRTRSRWADDLVEQAVRQLLRMPPRDHPAEG